MPLVCDEGFPALLVISGARELPPFGRSDMHALLPEITAMLGYVNGPGVFLAGFGVVTERGYGVPGPPWCSRAPQVKTGRSEDCLTERSEGVPQRRF